MTSARAILGTAAKAAQEALPLRWQRGEAQKDYELADCLPIVRAALLAALQAMEEPSEAMIQAACDATWGRHAMTPEEAHRNGWVAMAQALRAELETLR